MFKKIFLFNLIQLNILIVLEIGFLALGLYENNLSFITNLVVNVTNGRFISIVFILSVLALLFEYIFLDISFYKNNISYFKILFLYGMTCAWLKKRICEIMIFKMFFSVIISFCLLLSWGLKFDEVIECYGFFVFMLFLIVIIIVSKICGVRYFLDELKSEGMF